MFWSFRLMVALGFGSCCSSPRPSVVMAQRRLARKRWLLSCALWSIPLPWLAIELGWIVAEYGRQPWTISGVLPTHLSVSSLTPGQHLARLAGFVGFYTAAARRRALPDVQVRPPRPFHARHRPLSRRARHRASPQSWAPHDLRCSTTTTLKLIWWALVGVLLDRLRHPRRLRPGGGHAAALRRPQRRRTARVHQRRRPARGRATRSGSSRRAARSSPPGRWSTRRRSRASTAMLARAVRAVLAARSASTTGARSPIRAGAAPGTGACSSAAPCRRSIFGVAFGNLLQGVPFHFDADHARLLHRLVLRPAQPVRACWRAW